MTRFVVLLRGINVGKHRQLPMADLKRALDGLGYAEVRTHLRSGNVVLTAAATAAQLEEDIARAVEEDCGVPGVAIVVRTRDELAAAVEGNPWPDRTGEGKLLHVTFLSAEPSAAARKAVEAAATDGDEVAFSGAELYAYYVSGMQGSALAKAITDKTLGVTATDRNWNTVAKLLELADADAG